MRLFVALQIPTTTRENLATLIASLRAITREPRWVRSDNLHVTLKFLGEVAEDELAAVETALGRIRSDQAVTLEFRGLGFFPNEKKPRVFWAGIAASSNLKTLAADIEGAMEKCGIAREKRDAIAFFVGDDAIAVVLLFVDPAGTIEWFANERG